MACAGGHSYALGPLSKVGSARGGVRGPCPMIAGGPLVQSAGTVGPDLPSGWGSIVARETIRGGESDTLAGVPASGVAIEEGAARMTGGVPPEVCFCGGEALGGEERAEPTFTKGGANSPRHGRVPPDMVEVSPEEGPCGWNARGCLLGVRGGTASRKVTRGARAARGRLGDTPDPRMGVPTTR